MLNRNAGLSFGLLLLLLRSFGQLQRYGRSILGVGSQLLEDLSRTLKRRLEFVISVEGRSLFVDFGFVVVVYAEFEEDFVFV